MRSLLVMTMVLASWVSAQAQETGRAEILRYPDGGKLEASGGWRWNSTALSIPKGDSSEEEPAKEITDTGNDLTLKVSYGVLDNLTVSAQGGYLIGATTTLPDDHVWLDTEDTKDEIKSTGFEDVMGSVEFRYAVENIGRFHVGAELSHSFGDQKLTVEGFTAGGKLPGKVLEKNALSGGTSLLPYAAFQGQLGPITLGAKAEGTIWGTERTQVYTEKTKKTQEEEEEEENAKAATVELKQKGGGYVIGTVFGEGGYGPIALGLSASLKSSSEVTMVIPGVEQELPLIGAHKMVTLAALPRWNVNENAAVVGAFEYEMLLGGDKIHFLNAPDNTPRHIDGASGITVKVGGRYAF